MELLDRYEARYAPGAVPTEAVLEAFLIPMAEAAERNRQFVRVMGRLVAEGSWTRARPFTYNRSNA